MRIGVTAASGQLGRAIIKATCELVDHANVVGLARTPSKAADLGVTIRKGDYDKPDELANSLHGLDALLLISGMAPPTKRLQQHRNVIEAAKTAGVTKLVYTSIQGAEQGTAFSPIVQSNRQTEEDVRNSGLSWCIGRNGIYIEPDIDAIETYKERGEIANCAGHGRCGYTTRPELAYAYARMLTEPKHRDQTYHLHGPPITQRELAEYLNQAFGTNLTYRPMSVEAYRHDRVSELGEFLGTVIAGIYEGIQSGAVDNESQFHQAAGREHRSWSASFSDLARRQDEPRLL